MVYRARVSLLLAVEEHVAHNTAPRCVIEKASKLRRTGLARPTRGFRDCSDLGGHTQVPARGARRREAEVNAQPG